MRNTDVAIPHKVILMKNGATLWVTAETGTKLETEIINQQAHRFIRIKELDQTINTASIDQILTEQQYSDYIRLKKGDYQCKWRKWHDKKKDCDCERIAYMKQQEEDRRKQAEEESRELTPAERERRRRLLKETKDALIKKGVLPQR